MQLQPNFRTLFLQRCYKEIIKFEKCLLFTEQTEQDKASSSSDYESKSDKKREKQVWTPRAPVGAKKIYL